jgi:hypothetical protein
MKTQLKGRRVHTVPTRIAKDVDSLTENYFKATFQEWQECFGRCIAAHGDYLEGVFKHR